VIPTLNTTRSIVLITIAFSVFAFLDQVGHGASNEALEWTAVVRNVPTEERCLFVLDAHLSSPPMAMAMSMSLLLVVMVMGVFGVVMVSVLVFVFW